MKHAGKRVLSTVCALALLAAMLPAQAFATEVPESPLTAQEESLGQKDTKQDQGQQQEASGKEKPEGQDTPDAQQDPDNQEGSKGEGSDDGVTGPEGSPAAPGGEGAGNGETTGEDGTQAGGDTVADNGTANNAGAPDVEEEPADTAPTAKELQQRINALPAADALAALDDETRDAAYQEACDIEDALAQLSEEEKATLDTAKLDALFTWFNEQVSVQPEDDGDTTTPSEKVAQIVGGDSYATLDEAVENAPEGSTIELLKNCELTKGFNKTLTFTGNGKITINKQLTSNGEGWMCFGLYDPSRVLTFKGPDVEVEWYSEVGTAPWLMLSLSGTLNVEDGAKVTFNVDSGSTGTRNAIYMNEGSSINVTNGSTFVIKGNETAGKEGQGIQLDKTGKAEINIKGNSTFEIDGTNRGYVNSPTIHVEDSTLKVHNCTANASNGGVLKVVRSTVEYKDNAGHGISAGTLLIQDHSKVYCENNGYYGAYASSEFLVDGTSTLTVSGNSWAGDFAGLKITSGVADGSVEAGAIVTITDNYCSGLSNNGHLNFEEGAVLTITGNNNDKGTTTKGGGIYNSGSSAQLNLPSNATICNNHAINTDKNNGKAAGDDIFNNTTATITFGKVGTGWQLSDCKSDDGATVKGCTAGGVIDGWYDDSADEVDESGAITSHNRWNAHDGDGIYHVEKFDDFTAGKATVSRLLCLKAAHNAYATLQPADVTIYMGGAAGYQGVLEGETAVSSNSLPEPGFYFTLPADLNTTLSNVLDQEVGTASDLSSLVTVSATTKDGTPRNWTLERYGVKDGSSTAMINDGQEQFIYKIVPAQGQDPIRVSFTGSDDKTYTSDDFDPSTALYNKYKMDLYTGGVDVASITMTFTIPGENDEATKVYTCGYDDENSKEGTLTIRYASDNALTTQAKTSLDAVDKSSFGVVVAENQSFYINEQDYLADNKSTGVAVAASDVSLLADNIINEERVGDMYSLVAADAGFQNISMFAKYFDLVDTQNGNAWLTPADGTSVKVFWPYPAGTDKNTTFKLYHFEELDRELQVEDVAAAIADAPMTPVSITKEENGITFEVTSFSPFVLAWDKPQTSGGNDDNDGGNTNPAPASTPAPTAAPVAATPAPAVVPAAVPQTSDDMPLEALIVVTAAAAAAFVALLVVLKRRHGNDCSHP